MGYSCISNFSSVGAFTSARPRASMARNCEPVRGMLVRRMGPEPAPAVYTARKQRHPRRELLDHRDGARSDLAARSRVSRSEGPTLDNGELAPARWPTRRA